MDSSSVFTKKNRKESQSIKAIIIKIVLFSVLIPALLTAATFFISNEIESSSLRQTRILYTGPQDLRAFIEKDNDFNILDDSFDQQKGMIDSQTDIVLEVYGDIASVYFSPEKISSVIAYERLSKLIAQYGEISAQGESVAVYFESSRQGQIKEGEGIQFSLNRTVEFLLASLVSLLAFAILISGSAKVIKVKAFAFFDGKMTIVAQFISMAVVSFIASAFVTASIFVTVNYLIPPLLPVTVGNFTLMPNISAILIFLLSGFILGLSIYTLKICMHDFFAYIPTFFILCAIFLSMFTISDIIPDWSYFLPILNLLVIFKDAIMYGFEPGRLSWAIGVNTALCAVCIIISLKAAKSGYIIKKRNYYDSSR